jgi:hypothetical protein
VIWQAASPVMNALGVSLFVTLSLYLWRIFYPLTDLAVLFMVPLSLFLFVGSFRSSSAVYRAIVNAAVRGDSPYVWLLTGRLRSFLGALIFVFLAMPLLAWHAIASTMAELLLFGVLCFSASILFAVTLKQLLRHLTPAFARTTALTASTLIVSMIFIPLLAWSNWNFTHQPEAIRSVSLGQALQLGFEQLPVRRGLVAELLSPLFAMEYAKLWFVVQDESPKWFSFWYSIDAALISIIAARASAVLTTIAQQARGGSDESRPDC